MSIKEAKRLLAEARILERAAIENLEMAKTTRLHAEENLAEAQKGQS